MAFHFIQCYPSLKNGGQMKTIYEKIDGIGYLTFKVTEEIGLMKFCFTVLQGEANCLNVLAEKLTFKKIKYTTTLYAMIVKRYIAKFKLPTTYLAMKCSDQKRQNFE